MDDGRLEDVEGSVVLSPPFTEFRIRIPVCWTKGSICVHWLRWTCLVLTRRNGAGQHWPVDTEHRRWIDYSSHIGLSRLESWQSRVPGPTNKYRPGNPSWPSHAVPSIEDHTENIPTRLQRVVWLSTMSIDSDCHNHVEILTQHVPFAPVPN